MAIKEMSGKRGSCGRYDDDGQISRRHRSAIVRYSDATRAAECVKEKEADGKRPVTVADKMRGNYMYYPIGADKANEA